MSQQQAKILNGENFKKIKIKEGRTIKYRTEIIKNSNTKSESQHRNNDSSVTMILSDNNITIKRRYTPTVLEQEKKIERTMDNNIL